MFYHPEFIVYLWLIPVTLFVAIPAGLATCRVLMSAAKESPATKEEFALEQEVMAKA